MAAWADPPTVRDAIGQARDAQDRHGRVYGGQLAIGTLTEEESSKAERGRNQWVPARASSSASAPPKVSGAAPAVNKPRPPTGPSGPRQDDTPCALDAPLPHDVEPCPLPAPSDDCLTDGEADRRRGASSASRLADGKQPSPPPPDGPGLPSAGRVCGRRTHFYGGSCSREWGHKGCCR